MRLTKRRALILSSITALSMVSFGGTAFAADTFKDTSIPTGPGVGISRSEEPRLNSSHT